MSAQSAKHRKDPLLTGKLLRTITRHLNKDQSGQRPISLKAIQAVTHRCEPRGTFLMGIIPIRKLDYITRYQ